MTTTARTEHRYLITYCWDGQPMRYTLQGSQDYAQRNAAQTASTGGTDVVLRRGYGDHGVIATY